MIALVTGASSGIGRDIARELAKKKYNLIIVARNKKALEELKTELEEKEKIKVEIKQVDLKDRESCIKLYKEVKEKEGTIDVLINNAGFGTCGNFTETDLKTELEMIDTNITAVHILSKLFLKDMVKADKGYIMNVASIAGFMPGPLMATYYSTKAYIVRLSQSIRHELYKQKSKVKISTLCPGPVNTNFNKVANVKFNLHSQSSSYTAKYAVNKMLKNKALIFPSFFIWTARILSKIAPDKLSAEVCYHIQKRKIQ